MLLYWVGVDLGVMTMKMCYIFPRSTEQEPHHEMHIFEGVLSLSKGYNYHIANLANRKRGEIESYVDVLDRNRER